MTARNDPRLRQLAEIARASAPTHRAPVRKPTPKPVSTPPLTVVPEYARACMECGGLIVELATTWSCQGCPERGTYTTMQHNGRESRVLVVEKRGRRS